MGIAPIDHCSWGKFIIFDREHSESDEATSGFGKDICIFDSTVSEWKERKGHKLTPEMVANIFCSGVEVIIIGNGHYGRLKCPGKVIREIKSHGIQEVIVLRTPDACAEFNRQFKAGASVALFAHGTC